MLPEAAKRSHARARSDHYKGLSDFRKVEIGSAAAVFTKEEEEERGGNTFKSSCEENSK